MLMEAFQESKEKEENFSSPPVSVFFEAK